MLAALSHLALTCHFWHLKQCKKKKKNSLMKGSDIININQMIGIQIITLMNAVHFVAVNQSQSLQPLFNRHNLQ